MAGLVEMRRTPSTCALSERITGPDMIYSCRMQASKEPSTLFLPMKTTRTLNAGAAHLSEACASKHIRYVHCPRACREEYHFLPLNILVLWPLTTIEVAAAMLGCRTMHVGTLHVVRAGFTRPCAHLQGHLCLQQMALHWESASQSWVRNGSTGNRGSPDHVEITLSANWSSAQVPCPHWPASCGHPMLLWPTCCEHLLVFSAGLCHALLCLGVVQICSHTSERAEGVQLSCRILHTNFALSQAWLTWPSLYVHHRSGACLLVYLV